MTRRSTEGDQEGVTGGDRGADDDPSRTMIDRLQAADPTAFEELYDRYFSRLYGYVRSLVVSTADAEDITHHVFEQMLSAASRGGLRDVRSLRHWLFAVARNRALDFQRVHSRIDLSAPDELRERLTDVGDEPDLVLTFDDPALAGAIRRMPRLQREVLLLRYVEDFDLAEIAVTTGSTKSSVQNAHSLALRSLRQLLEWP